jgi:hypothetical protein
VLTREGWCHHHIQAILVAIDQYAEAATGNREYFLNKPHSIGGSRKTGDVPQRNGLCGKTFLPHE